MVLFAAPSPNNNRRLCLIRKGGLFPSWKSSKTSVTRGDDEESDTGSIKSVDVLRRRRVHFDQVDLVTEIPEEGKPITREEIQKSWYKVRHFSFLFYCCVVCILILLFALFVGGRL